KVMERFERGQLAIQANIAQFHAWFGEAITPIRESLSKIRSGGPVVGRPVHQRGVAPPAPERKVAGSNPARSNIVVEGDLKITATQQRILDALAWYESIGNFFPSTLQVGAIALIDASGGHFSNTVGP